MNEYYLSLKDLGIISSDCFSRLPVDLKSAVCKLAQNRGQIFEVLEGTWNQICENSKIVDFFLWSNFWWSLKWLPKKSLFFIPLKTIKANQAKNSMDGLFLTIDSPP